MKPTFTLATVFAIGVPAVAEVAKPDAAKSEMKKLAGLWQTSPGGMEHRDGSQIVRLPVLYGPCFFVCEDRLIWLDDDGKPTGKVEKIEVDVKVEPMRITLKPVGKNTEEKPSHGIFRATGSSLIIHFGIDGGSPPKHFLELNKAVNGVDGSQWLVHRKKLSEK